MRIVSSHGREDLSTVFVAELGNNRFVEFVESVEPPLPRTEKWVSIVSTLFGCPAGCLMCDAGSNYLGKLTANEIIDQIDYLVTRRYPSGKVQSAKWKIQFARMGDPALNPAVLDVLEKLPTLYDAPGLMPSVSTIAPNGTDLFFERLAEIKLRLYPLNFQFQFSVHTTDTETRHRLIPVRTWDLERMAAYGKALQVPGGRKSALNFALMEDVPFEPKVIADIFDPACFIIKVTPLNPTARVEANSLVPMDIKGVKAGQLVDSLQRFGFEVIVSIGELDENIIGSNCGQYVSTATRPGSIKAQTLPAQVALSAC